MLTTIGGATPAIDRPTAAATARPFLSSADGKSWAISGAADPSVRAGEPECGNSEW